MSEVFP